MSGSSIFDVCEYFFLILDGFGEEDLRMSAFCLLSSPPSERSFDICIIIASLSKLGFQGHYGSRKNATCPTLGSALGQWKHYPISDWKHESVPARREGFGVCVLDKKKPHGRDNILGACCPLFQKVNRMGNDHCA